MSQQSITSFFTPTKRKSQPTERVLPNKLKPNDLIKSPLSSFLHSSPNGESKVSQAYQQKFRKHFLGKTTNLTNQRREMKPYDLQFIELKQQHADSVLMIQNGYKYQILGEDAYKVARFLGRSPIAGWRSLKPEEGDVLYDRFASLTFPIERLNYYVEKLVMQGLKVSVAKQVETQALRSNKRGPFKREVTHTYTQGTMVEELTSTTPVAGHILALLESDKMYLAACQPATGDAVYDEFGKDLNFELETRLMHIQPSEIVVLGEVSTNIKRILNMLNVRLVYQTKEEGVDGVDACFAGLKKYLNEFNLGSALSFKSHPFSLKNFMYLNGDTLESLEIFTNQTTKETIGSLFWALNNTRTQFGSRLLKNWIGKPLLNRELIHERVEAMEEIMFAEGDSLSLFSSLTVQLKKLPDLERYTLQIYHNRINPRQLFWCLHFLNSLIQCVSKPQLNAAKLKSPKLQSIFEKIEPLRDVCGVLLAKIDAQRVRYNKDQQVNLTEFFDKHYFTEHGWSDNVIFKDLCDCFMKLKQTSAEIAELRAGFDVYLADQSTKLNLSLKHAHALGEEDTFVIGVPKRDATKVPVTWRRQGAVSAEVRFWSPESLDRAKKLKPLLETEQLLAKTLFDLFVDKIAEQYFDMMHECVKAVAELDCLMSMALVSSRPRYVKPDLVDEPCLEIADGRHPMLDQLMLNQFVPNSTKMYKNKNRVMIITGANMGGKSSFVRQVALIVIMAQLGCYVPATSARLSIVDAVYTRMGAFDNLMRGESTFMVELKECASIMAKATNRSLVLLDEVGRGTSTMDGMAIANAVLEYMIHDVKCFTLFITHYQWLCSVANNHEVLNWSMDCCENDDEVTFLYTIVKRAASQSYGINVARLAQIPESVLATARAKSQEFEKQMETKRQNAHLRQAVDDCLKGKISPEKLLLENQETETFGEIEETQ